MVLGAGHQLPNLIRPADVSRVDAHLIRPVFQGRHGQPVVKMHVRHQGDGASGRLAFNAPAASISGTVQRTIWQPASTKARIWAMVATGSRVSVLVMVGW